MSEDRFNYGETLCEAIDTIISKKLEGLSYDITKTCIVIDDTYKKQGRYVVADGALKFEAYSTITTLNINDNVLVNIPYGDYSLQKTILNKIIYNDKLKSLNYISPLDNMLKFTNNIIEDLIPVENIENNGFSILANDNDVLLKKLYSFTSWDKFSGFDRMGIAADFHTKLNQYNIINGNYGIKFLFYNNNNSVTELDFGINDMNGNPYHFDTFFNQSKLFDISKLENIKSVDIYLYQNNNFINEDGDRIPSIIEGDPIANIPESKINNNIFIRNLKIYLGYDISTFTEDSVKISTPGYPYYNKADIQTDLLHGGRRYLNLRWIHKISDNEYISLTKEDVVKKNIKVYWFKYALNQSNSEFTQIAGGPNWTTEGIEQSYNKDVFQSWFQPDYNKAQERIRAVCGIPNELGEYEYFRSEILTFDNEQAIIDTLTYDAATQLSIICSDGSEGNYFIYNPSGKIINEGQGQGYERKFEARFRGIPIDNPESGFKNISQITWIIPTDGSLKHTMLTYNDDYWNNADCKDTATGDLKYITRVNDGINPLITTQSYSIKNNWHSSNSSNLVRCEIIADGMVYETSLDLQFGKAGTSGTNITLVLEFDNNENALIYKNNENSECTIKASMYDMAGSKITNPEGIWNWSWFHKNNYIEIQDSNSSSVKLTLPNNYDTIDLENNYHILVATFTPPSGESIVSTPITSYLPIPIKKQNYDYIEGAREVIYNAQGVPEYYTDAYVLYGADANNNKQVEISSEKVKWILKHFVEDNEEIIEQQYQLSLKSLNKNGVQYSALSASPFYIKNYNDKVCIYAIVDNEIVWSQPILIMQSQYDYATLNNWNGSVNVGDKTIMSAMLGAGKKDENNSFSGIVIGDLSSNIIEAEADENISSSTGIGLYGLSKGVISFSLTEMGIATFGKLDPVLNQGQVVLGGDANTITDANGYYHIDIDKGFNKILYNNGEEKLAIGDDNANSYNNYLLLCDKNKNNILNFSKDIYLLQSSNYGEKNGLQINLHEGKLIAGNGQDNLLIDSTSNSALTIGRLNIKWDGTINVSTDSSEKDIIHINNLRIAEDGTIYYQDYELSDFIKKIISEEIE